MDPPLINETSFSTANPSSYTLTEIWPFHSINGGSNVAGLGLRMPDFDVSVEESTVTEHSGGNGTKRRGFSSEDESSKIASSTCSGNNGLKNSNEKRLKSSVNGNLKSERESATSIAIDKACEQSSKPSEPPKQDYIHVRARRGQATDSHSLAERARREKISERMKILQDLVPGCNKVIGKALVLDEIINYVQSLQQQVEFLSMKLEAVNTRMNIAPTVEGFNPKDVGSQSFDGSGMVFGSQTAEPEWLHMQIGGNFQGT